MKIYRFIGNGIALGATVIVAAKSKKTAKKLLQEEVGHIGENKTLIEREATLHEIKIDGPCVIYTDDGDY